MAEKDEKEARKPEHLGEDFKPALHLMARRFVEGECSCGHHGTSPEAHTTECRYRQAAERYLSHSTERQKGPHAERAHAAVLARTKNKRKAAEAAAAVQDADSLEEAEKLADAAEKGE